MGRRRRWSNSTVATVDEERIRYINETAVLTPMAPEYEDDWHFSFVLEDATVYNKKGELANLLSVAFDGPFTIKGLIRQEEQDVAQKDHFLRRTLKSAYISIEGCTRYSVGLGGEDCKSPCIWAGGKCGWYELRPPAPDYVQIHSKMNRAVSLYYFLQDIHKDYEKEQRRGKPKKGPKKPKRDDILASLDINDTFLKYAVVCGDGSVLEEVVAACDEHAPFLISQFSQDEKRPAGDEEKFNWRPTTFYKWLVPRHPDVVEQVAKSDVDRTRSAVQAPSNEPQPILDNASQKTLSKPGPAAGAQARKLKNTTRNSVASSRQSISSRRSSSRNHSSPEAIEVDSRDFATKRRSRSSRPSDEVKKQSLPTTAIPTTSTDIELSTMDIDPAQPAKAFDTPPVVEDLEMQDAVQTPAQLLLVAVERLGHDAEKPVNELTFGYIKSNLYYRHKIKRYDIAGEILEYYSAELLPMLDKGRWAPSGFFRELQRMAQGPRKEPENFSLDEINHNLQRRATTERNPAAKAGPARNHTLEVETPQQRKRGRPAGKMSSLRPSNKKRIMDDSGEGVRSFKYAKTSHLVGQHIDEDDSDVMDDSSEEEDDDVAPVETPIPAKVRFEAEKLPDLTATGPNGTWVCDQDDDCAFVERNPDSIDGKDRIEHHIESEHQDESRTERLNLAMMEGGRGHLPVDHLLEKIRRMGAKIERDDGKMVNEQLLSKPVKRQLLV